MDSEKLNNLKKKLEKEGEEKVKKLFSETTVNTGPQMQEALAKIMKDGEKEFVEKTGRYMTYSEMREMYG
jgi:hypothetical protein|uniref:Uncharacterized protein n=1 Tax=viral metagenome TaxID=1070528 RepID=A0A6C0HD76_9ZZZZ